MNKICIRCNEEKQCPEEFTKGGKKKDNSYYYSVCKDCHNKYQRKYKLKTGKIKTMPRGTPVENLIGKKFGKLLVIEYKEYKQFKRQKKHMWLCRCDCGSIKSIVENNLKCNYVKSCGCLIKLTGSKHHNFKGHKQISGQYWCHIKGSSKLRNIEFNITIEYAWRLFEKQNRKCILSNKNLHFADTQEKHKHGHTTASLDRIDSTKGYIKGNVQWVHKKVNIMKGSMSDQEFIDWCKRIVNNN